MRTQPRRSEASSPDSSLNHRLDDGKWRRTIGPINRSPDISTNGNADSESQSEIIAPRKQRIMTIAFGARNHKRRPRRNERAMPIGNDSRQRPIRPAKRMLDNDSPPSRHAFTIAQINNRTDSTTYVQAIASTITTGNGFFKSSMLPDLMGSRAVSPCTVLYHNSPDRITSSG